MNPVKLHDYQEDAKNFIKNTDHCGLFLPVGLGKSLITLQALYELNQPHHTLIVAPIAVARATWSNEINKWKYPFRTKSMILTEKFKKLSRKKRLEIYEQAPYETEPTIYFINQELVTDLVRNVPRFHGAPYWAYQTVIIDELQAFKSYKAERFKAMKGITPYIQRFVGLTATPTPKSMEDLWAEIFLMDGGIRLGKTITSYRNNYFNPGLCMNGYPVSWSPKPNAEEIIYEKVSDIVISMKNTMLKLPPITYNDVIVYMDESEQKLYKTMKKDNVISFMVDNKESDIAAVNAGVLHIKLTQMASGALYVDENHRYIVIHTKKLEMTEYIINNSVGPVLIAYYFQSDKDMLLRYLNSKTVNLQATAFDGSPTMIDDWNAGKLPIMLIQPASAGAGLNLQDSGHTLIWYTIPNNLEQYIQTNGRIYRQGQKNPVVIHHLITQGTVDAKNLNRLTEKDMSQQSLMDAINYALSDTDLIGSTTNS